MLSHGACQWIGGEGEGDGTATADSSASDSTGVALADSAQADSAQADSQIVEAVPVETALARRGAISAFLLFSSTVETEEAVEIYPQRGGMVEAVLAEEGDRVAAGDTLVRLAEEETRIEYQESQASLEHTRSEYERTDTLYRRKLISQQEYANQKYQLEQARLRYERAQLALEHTVITAPFTGMITTRQVQVGSRLNTGGKLFDLIKLDDLIARVYVPGQYLTAIAKGQRALLTSDFLEGRQFNGWVKRISPVVDPRSGTFKVTVGIEDRWEYLRPGVFVNVRIVTDTHEDAVLLPKQAIVYDGGERFVFVVKDSIASRVRLDAGYEDSDSVEALSGIEAGAPVIIVGQNGLKDEAKVRIVNVRPDADTVRDDGAPEQG